jgi:hypothetical protein
MSAAFSEQSKLIEKSKDCAFFAKVIAGALLNQTR